ncbi:MAG: hypothetical protein QOG64_1848 [Acidimicrobiaceae bacterium]|nr:hypothetical protein [Acidimicrobiaceae bacterium]
MIVAWWYGGFAVAAGLLAAAGGLKLVRPAPTARAMASVGLPSRLALVRAASAAEVVAGTGALWWPSRPMAGVVALSYAGFAAFVVLARARGGTVSSCGCFGETDAAPTVLHVVLDLAAAGFAMVAVVRPPWSLGRIIGGDPVPAIVLLVLVALGGYLAFLAMSVLPRTSAAAVSWRRP